MQLNKDYQIKGLEWDTKFFNITSAKITLFNQLTQIKFVKLLEESKQYHFVTLQNNNNNEYNNFIIATNSNAFLTDVNIQLEKNIYDIKYNNDLYHNIYIENNMNKNKNILEISKVSFKYSRFINDSNLKNGKLVYYNWVNNSFNNKEKYFCYYKINNQVLGFILFSMKAENTIIELIAIDEKNKNQGIGKKLIYSVEQFSANNNIKTIKVGTQINNIIAQNFYIKCGFKHTQNNSIYHLWR